MAATDLFRSMIAYWKEFDLQKLQEELDRAASVLAVQCEETDVSRQILLQKSREFKRNCSEELQKATAPLLKCFQTEIDGLLRRSKLAESAFLAVYKKLIQMPDMMPVLVAADQLQSEVARLQGCFTESTQQQQQTKEPPKEPSKEPTKEPTNRRNRRRHCGEKNGRKERDDRTCALIGTDHFDSSVQSFSHLPTPPQQAMESQAELNVSSADRPNEDGVVVMTSRNLHESSVDMVEPVGSSSKDADRNSNAVDGRVYDHAMSLPGGGVHVAREDQQDHDIRRDRGNVVVSRREDDLSRRNSVPDAMTTNRADELSPSGEVVNSNFDVAAGGVDVDKECLTTSDVCAARNDDDVIEPNPDVIENISANRDDNRWDEDSQPDDGNALIDHAIHRESTSQNAVPSGPLPDNGTVLDDGTADGTVLDGTERDCERSFHTDLRVDVVRMEDNNVRREVGDRTLEDESGSQQPEDIQLEHKMDFHEKWKDPARQTDKEMDLSSNNLSKMEDLASQIGHEIVTSFHNSSNNISQFPQPRLWHPDGTTTKSEEGCSFLPTTPHLLSHPPSFPTDLSASHLELTPEGMKVEGGDETGTAPLDTLEVARHVREILSFHNLGQRLFARYVLGLSQGTVSELLSKPKHWEKLTEKGRESYRKMHQWASSECNIQTLKSLSSPKCNVSSSSPSSSSSTAGGRVDAVAEERIAQILSEAQAAMQLKQETTTEQLHQNGLLVSRMPDTYSRPTVNQTTEPDRAPPRKSKATRNKTSSANSSSRNEALKNRKVESEQLTREIVARIYQEQLEKLAQVAEASGNVVELLTYRQELARLSQGWARRPVKPDGLKEDKENRDEAIERPKKFGNDGMERLPEIKMDVDQPQDLSVNGSSDALYPTQEASSAFPSSVKSGFSPTPAAVAAGGSLLSPLQRMQSIANSLMLQSPSSSSQTPQPTRAVLPPISQEQFDLYANIGTDELVKRVKDVLSQYSISQRLFGEFVLGLSQGSVSDLLARPKPWHLLTQKGREPFIRMQMFVDDSEAVQKLVASQYRVPPEKLLHGSNPSSQMDERSCGVANENSTEEVSNLPDFPARPASRSSTPFHSPTTSFSACDAAVQSRSDALSCAIFSSSVSSSPSRSEGTPVSTFDKSLTSSGVGFPPMGVAMVPSVLSLFGATFLPSNQFSPLMNMDLHRLYGPGGSAGAGSAMVPNPQAPPDAGAELDTQAITARVKEVLQLNNLGQKLFGEAVLELSQGSVSELLSKPKPWHMLSLKGREPFVKMQIWLNDPLGVQKLHAYQTHMAGRKRKSTSEGGGGSSNDKPGSQKKPRLFFSEEQKEALRAAYQRDPYPNQLAIEQLASSLDIGVKTVINWFHNHRMRAKQHQTSCNSPTSTTAGSPSALGRVKSEASEDLPESTVATAVGATQWMSSYHHHEESMSHFPPRLSKCDSASPSSDRRAERRPSSDAAPGKMLGRCSPNAKSGSTESKRHELNKRKRARPHRLYSGAATAVGEIPAGGEFQAATESPDAREFRASAADVAIDLSMGRSSEVVVQSEGAAAAPTENHRACEAGNRCKPLKDRDDDCATTTTLQKKKLVVSPPTDCFQSVKRELAEDWNGNRRIKNIEKLQQNLSLAPSDEWEF